MLDKTWFSFPTQEYEWPLTNVKCQFHPHPLYILVYQNSPLHETSPPGYKFHRVVLLEQFVSNFRYQISLRNEV